MRAEGSADTARRDWGDRIAAAWRKTVEGFLEAGRLIAEAKAALPHGEFLAMIEHDLPFKPSTAQRLMKIAADKRLSNAAHVQLLPPHWGTLYELTKLDDKRFEQKLASGQIHPEMLRRDVASESWLIAKKRDEARVKALEPAPGRYRTLVIDPAWDYDWLSVAGRAKPGYAMQSHEELMALDVRSWADERAGCHLYLWTTNNFSGRAHELMKQWGFEHRTIITWIKPPPFGLGSYFRNSTEHVLFGTLGDTTTRPVSASIPTHFEAPRGEHSEKPEEFYDIVRKASYPPYGEANQRKPRPDFTSLYREPAPENVAGSGRQLPDP